MCVCVLLPGHRYHEAEALSCNGCTRWFCYGCSCVSCSTIPEGAWSCFECVGQELYDQELSRRISGSRAKLKGMNQKEHDAFAQLVFDLSCGCFWEEWALNVHPLIERCEEQLGLGELPSILPFHSLHYPMSKATLRQISEAYAHQTAMKADRSFRCPCRLAL